jgi:hypothetical protein
MPQVPQNQFGFAGRGIKTRACHLESPLGARDLHSHWNLRWILHCYSHLQWLLLFLPFEISNLKFEISEAFVFFSKFAPVSIFSATSLAA